MMRRLTKIELLARMPRAFLPKLKPDQLRDLGLSHNENLDAITQGDANETIIWDYVGGVLTWWRVARLLNVGKPEMDLQLGVAVRLVERFGTTQRVQFDVVDLALARTGVMVMDMLAEIVDRATAIAAADWSESEVARMAAVAPERTAREAQAA